MNKFLENPNKRIIIIVSIWLLIGLGIILMYMRDNDDFFSSLAKLKETKNPNLVWRNPEDSQKYANVLWHEITTPRLSGFTPKPDELLELSIPHNSYDWSGHIASSTPYNLRREGLMLSTYYYLSITRNGIIEKIDTEEKLKAAFAPIDSEEEAMSFIAVTASDTKIINKLGSGVLRGYTAAVDGGYLVKFVFRNTFFCTSHQPLWIIVKVTKAGDMLSVAYEKEPKGITACVD